MDKEKIVKLQKIIKEEKPMGQRLKSLKLPRDLSLGGTKQSKKQVVPNVNVVRNKDKAREVRKTEHKRKEKVRDIKENTRERYVQSSGIFSEGTAGDIRKSRSDRWNSSSKENDVASYMPIPTITKDCWQICKEDEESVLEKILKQEEDNEDEKLPFKPVVWNENILKDKKVSVKREIKKEPEESVIAPTLKSLKLEESVIHGLPIEYQYQELYNNYNPNLTLWSLPDSFAGKGLSDDPDCKKLFDYCLTDMTEGQIGKLIIRQSGRIEVYIGRVKYDLEPTELQSCAEDVVALEVKDSKDSAAALLGQIQNRFLLNPSWKSLLFKRL